VKGKCNQNKPLIYI